MAVNEPSNARTVVGVFEDRPQARAAVEDLKRAGFRDDQIGFAAREGGSAAGATAGAGSGEVTTDTGSGSGAATGAMTGGLLGGLIGAAAALLIPGIGPIVAGGILASALGGAALGAAGGGIVGGLVTTGVSEEDARYYDSEFQTGKTVVTVQAGGKAAEAEAILRRHGGTFAAGATGTSRQPMAGGMSGQTTAGMGGASTTMKAGDGTIRVPEMEERLNVEKREVQQGEVQIRKTVEEHTETVPVELKREEVHVERRDVAERPMKPGEGAFEEGTIKVPVRGEEAVVTKEAVVTGEVVVNKERTTEREEIADTVRRTEVHVDKSGDTTRKPDRPS
ncbi:MAG TPA: YsnF/AvaK domain-containing protein [Chloroflexota bacterium]|nr:YsnF/AvaK domain-containing protein [Chloroflexota bacterium]